MYSVFVKLMEENGLTPYRVAKEAGITQATLSRWKTGKVNPSLETLQVLADYFHVSIDYLMGKPSAEKVTPLDTQKESPDLQKTEADNGLYSVFVIVFFLSDQSNRETILK